MNKTYIGIDPGKQGGIAILSETPPIVSIMPLIAKTEIDVQYIMSLLFGYKNVHVVIEDVHSIFNMSAASNFEFGFGCGMLYSTLKISGVPFTKVAPKTWQKEMWTGVKPVEILTKEKKKDGSPKYKIDTKATSLLAVKRIFPNIDLRASERCEKDHDGIVDALLMAEFGRRNNY